MRSLIVLASLSALLLPGGCAVTSTARMSTPDGQAIAAVDPGPWHSDTSSVVFRPIGPGDVRQAYWWQGDPAWRAFLLPGVPGAESMTAGRSAN